MNLLSSVCLLALLSLSTASPFLNILDILDGLFGGASRFRDHGYMPKCKTIFETHHETVQKEKCPTHYEQQCSTWNEKKCNTLHVTEYQTEVSIKNN